MKRVLPLLAACVVLTGCAVTSTDAVWKSLPEIQQTSYDDAWAIIVGAVTDQFDLEVVDANSGYLRTSWKTDNDIFGDPQSRTRVVFRIISREPLQFKMKAEKQEISALTNDWIDSGNDEAVESVLLEELQARLN